MFTLECKQRWSVSALKQRNRMPCPLSLSSTRSFPPPPLSSTHWPMVDTHPTVVGRTHKVKVSQALSLTYRAVLKDQSVESDWDRRRNKLSLNRTIDSFWPSLPQFSPYTRNPWCQVWEFTNLTVTSHFQNIQPFILFSLMFINPTSVYVICWQDLKTLSCPQNNEKSFCICL